MNNDINIASRANLYSNFKKCYSIFQSNLKEICDFNNEIQADLKAKYKDTIGKQYLYSIFSSMEVLFIDSAIHLLVSYPGKIENIKSDAKLLTEVSTLTEAIRHYATKKVNELSYKKLSEFISDIYDMFGERTGVNKSVIDKITEGKATRDLYMHNNGKSNFIYFEKAGKLSRVNDNDKHLDINEKYLDDLKSSIEVFGKDFKEKCIDKHVNDNPTETFKNMWEMSSLNKVVKFERQWEIVDKSIHKKDFEWAWSGSEEALFNFFSHIHGSKSIELRISDIPYALRRWKGQTDERIIQSWLESQFYL